MTAEQFVKQKYPHVLFKNSKGRGPFGKISYQLWTKDEHGRFNVRLGYGDTKSKAWVNAKERIIELDKPQTS